MQTTKQRKRIEQLKALLEKGDLAILKHLFELEDSIEEKVESLSKEIKPLTETQMEAVNRIVESVVANIRLKEKGDKGDNYIISEEDKQEIAELAKSLVQIPIDEIASKASKLVKTQPVEKIIERTEIIKEQPIVTNEIREVALSDTPEVVRDKLESIEEGNKLSIQAIQDLSKILEELRELIGAKTVIRGGGLSSSALNMKFIDDETPTGTVDGSNTIFTLANSPIPTSVKVYVGGSRQRVTEDYTLSGRTITFTLAPTTNDIILVDYRII